MGQRQESRAGVDWGRRAAVEQLQRSGFSEPQAEGLMDVVDAKAEQFATKEDFLRLENAMNVGFAEIRAAIKAGFAEHRAETKAERAEHRAELAQHRTETKDDLALHRAETKAERAERRAETKVERAEFKAVLAETRGTMKPSTMKSMVWYFNAALVILTLTFLAVILSR